MFTKLLIANRGEIACRVIKTAARLGVRTAAVYSDADALALHVRSAHEAIRIGPAAARDSYLDIERVIAAAHKLGADAVHPGYGFLAENADFADACVTAGLVFVGPPAAAIRAMGSKSVAKEIMADAGIPIVPGYYGEDQSARALQVQAQKIGYPLLIKATAGGGGKGMRIVHADEQFEAALASAQREAASAFGDDRVLLEKYLANSRHIEFQIFCDDYGSALHLFERDCSLQRRYQKIIEESPAPDLASDLREKMGQSAIAAARSVDYRNAGTVEFIVAESGEFYFMEMNTRLQVEHPVTELITGQDLVEWQLRVAAGEPLPLSQDALNVRGHAFEARLYAEDPSAGFLPAIGNLAHIKFADGEPRVRVDTGVADGDTISMHYDPMIAKVIAWGDDRESALKRLSDAVSATEIVGVKNNQTFLNQVLSHSEFVHGGVATNFIDNNLSSLLPAEAELNNHALACACLYLLLTQKDESSNNDPYSPWSSCNGWRLNASNQQIVNLLYQGERIEITVEPTMLGFLLRLPDLVFEARATVQDKGEIRVNLDGWQRVARVVDTDGVFSVFIDGQQQQFARYQAVSAGSAVAGAGTLRAPMPGTVTAVMVEVGASVTRGTALLVLEAMKMEHTITAPADGVVKSIHYQVGDLVPEEGLELLNIEPPEQSDQQKPLSGSDPVRGQTPSKPPQLGPNRT